MNNELSRFWGISYEGFIDHLLEELQTNPDETILDIATGTAFIPSYLNRHAKPFKRIIGLDLTFQMLENAHRNMDLKTSNRWFSLVCASAHAMPLREACIDRAICCLATHHMDTDLLLTNIYYLLRQDGIAHIADAGGSTKWENAIIRFFIKSAAFIYFLFVENYARAAAESSAIANIHTVEEWVALAEKAGFTIIEIKEMKSRKFWAPNPIILKIQKRGDE